MAFRVHMCVCVYIYFFFTYETPCLVLLTIIESLRLEKTSKIIKSYHQPITTRPARPCPKCHVYMFFEPLQGWGLHHLPGQPGPRPDHSFNKEIFPSIQSEPPLTQLEAIASSPFAGCLGEETNPHLPTPSCQGVVESEKVPPQRPLLQTEQPQLPQPLPITLVLQTPPQPRCPSLDTLQPLHVLLGVRAPTRWVEGDLWKMTRLSVPRRWVLLGLTCF